MTNQTLDDFGDLLHIEEVIAYLKCDKQFIYREIQKKNLKALKIGRRFKIPKTALAEYLKKMEV